MFHKQLIQHVFVAICDTEYQFLTIKSLLYKTVEKF